MSSRDDILLREAQLGRAALSATEKRVYLLYRTICELENGGLSGLLYNVSPDWDYLSELSQLLSELGESELAQYFREAETICRLGPSGFRGTWSGWLAVTDPENRLDRISDSIWDTQEQLWDRLDENEK